ncbi:16982_t:CDS:10 [Racocetra fulgida]|uniref:Enhancer of polycomb-like protein n=1 Tax=Racocetra fulgida TaxID=60492 RepID=A0A9N9BRN3_9GLOM|nr:16982_t:CDS:10 [Racocetra fulgida]
MSSFKFNPNMNLNRKSFRQRKVDNKKPMRIMFQHEISEEDMLPVSRAGVDVETGVEKEEEEEIHLVTALEKRQQGIEEGNGTSTGDGEPAIPCPDSDANKRHLFPPTWKMSHTFLKFSTPILECVGCLYNMDEDDEKWLNEYNSKSGNNLSEDDFEEIMEFLENQAKNKPHLLTAETKDEEDNPYVCFRRRELKPIRKTRRTETQSFDKLRRIRRDVHNGREIIVKVKARERFKKQRIELNRKIFIKECDIKEMRKELGIQNNSISDSQQRNRRISTSSMDTIGKFDADKLMLPPAFRSRYGRGGRKRRTIDRLDVFTIYRMKRPKNNKFKYDSDEMDDVYSDDDMDCDEIDDNEDFQNLGAFRTKIQKDKQNSPRQCSRDDDPRVSLSGSQSRPSSDVRSNSEPRAEGSSSRGNPDSRITIDMDSSRPNILPRTVVDQRSVRPNYDPNLTSRTAQIPIRDQRVNSAIPVSISNRDQHLSTDISVSRDQLLNTGSLTGRDQRLSIEQNQSSDQRLLNESRPNIDARANLSHNGHAVRASLSLNHRDATPYRRPIPRNVRISEDSTNANGVSGLGLVQTTRITSPLQGGATGIVPTNVHINGHGSVMQLSQMTPQVATRQLSGNTQTNVTSAISSAELTRTSSNPGIIMNNTTPVLTRTPSNPGMMVNSVTPGLSRTPSNPGVIINDPNKINNGTALVNSGHRITITNGGQPTFTNGSPVAPSQQATHLNVQSTRPHMSINNPRGLSNEQFVHSSDQNNLQMMQPSNIVTPSTAANQTSIQTIIVPSIGSNGQPNSSSQQIQNNGTNNIVPNNGSSNLRQGNVQANSGTTLLRHAMNQNFVHQSGVVGNNNMVRAAGFPLARFDRDSLQAFGILPDSVQQVNSASNPNIRQTNMMSPNGQNNVNSMRQSFLMSNGAVSVASNMAQINQRPVVLSNGTVSAAFVANGVPNLNVRQMQANVQSSINLRPMTPNGIRQVHPNGASSQGLRQNIVVPTNGFMNASPVQLSSNVSISNLRQPNIPSQASPTRDSTNGM